MKEIFNMSVKNVENDVHWTIRTYKDKIKSNIYFTSSTRVKWTISQYDDYYIISVFNFNVMLSCKIEGKFGNIMLTDYLNIFENLNKDTVTEIYNIFNNREDVIKIEFRINKFK